MCRQIYNFFSLPPSLSYREQAADGSRNVRPFVTIFFNSTEKERDNNGQSAQESKWRGRQAEIENIQAIFTWSDEDRFDRAWFWGAFNLITLFHWRCRCSFVCRWPLSLSSRICGKIIDELVLFWPVSAIALCFCPFQTMTSAGHCDGRRDNSIFLRPDSPPKYTNL